MKKKGRAMILDDRELDPYSKFIIPEKKKDQTKKNKGKKK